MKGFRNVGLENKAPAVRGRSLMAAFPVPSPEPRREYFQNTWVVTSLLLSLWSSTVAQEVDQIGVIFIIQEPLGLSTVHPQGSLSSQIFLWSSWFLIKGSRDSVSFWSFSKRFQSCTILLSESVKVSSAPCFSAAKDEPEGSFWIKDFNFTSYKESDGNNETPNSREATKILGF